MKPFHVAIEGVWMLNVGQVWPDGDAPENPTAEDVLEQMRAYGDVRAIIGDWNLVPELTVDGKAL